MNNEGPNLEDMDPSTQRDFYSAMATGLGGGLGLTLSVLTEPGATQSAAYTMMGALGFQVVYIKARQIYENLKGVQWKLEEVQ